MDIPETMSTAAIVELRQYTLHPGATADLVALFEREFIEPQEEAGMRVGGLFQDRDDPDRFVWFRGFTTMDARRHGLETFYGGPVWHQFRDDANATMIDSDDVLLLRPTDPAHPVPEPAAPRAATSDSGPSTEWVTLSVYEHPDDPDFARWLATDFHDAVQDQLGVTVATFRTDPSENTFPALPVRADNVFAWTTSFPHQDAYDAARARLEASQVWREKLSPRLNTELIGRQYLRLQPTARSQHPAPMSRQLARRPR